jgi:hypothetical protein
MIFHGAISTFSLFGLYFIGLFKYLQKVSAVAIIVMVHMVEIDSQLIIHFIELAKKIK